LRVSSARFVRYQKRGKDMNDPHSSEIKQNTNAKRRASFGLRPLFISCVLVIVVIVAAGVVLFSRSNRPSTADAYNLDPNDQATIEELGKLMLLPDESPSIATVLDKTKLADQPFFANAENDDKLILFTQAGKAILYRPSSKRVIEVMPLVLPGTVDTDAVN
jgi:hypothetical protein